MFKHMLNSEICGQGNDSHAWFDTCAQTFCNKSEQVFAMIIICTQNEVQKELITFI